MGNSHQSHYTLNVNIQISSLCEMGWKGKCRLLWEGRKACQSQGMDFSSKDFEPPACVNCAIVFSHVLGTTSSVARQPLLQRDGTPIMV